MEANRIRTSSYTSCDGSRRRSSRIAPSQEQDKEVEVTTRYNDMANDGREAKKKLSVYTMEDKSSTMADNNGDELLSKQDSTRSNVSSISENSGCSASATNGLRRMMQQHSSGQCQVPRSPTRNAPHMGAPMFASPRAKGEAVSAIPSPYRSLDVSPRSRTRKHFHTPFEGGHRRAQSGPVPVTTNLAYSNASRRIVYLNCAVDPVTGSLASVPSQEDLPYISPASPVMFHHSGPDVAPAPNRSGAMLNSATFAHHGAAANASDVVPPMHSHGDTMGPGPAFFPGPAVHPDSVILGVQQLERQQADLEARQHYPCYPPNIAVTIPFAHDQAFQPYPSSTGSGSLSPMHNFTLSPHPTGLFPAGLVGANSNLPATSPSSISYSTMHPPPAQHPSNPHPTCEVNDDTDGLHSPRPSSSATNRQTSFGRFFSSMIKKPDSTTDDNSRHSEKQQQQQPQPVDKDDCDVIHNQTKPFVFGYLHKLTRNGVWQRRFFEIDGEYLTYYKSQKRSKCLATLDLVNVGSIAVDSQDPTGCTFTVQVSARLYYLRAEDSATCKDWVINLNRVREARIEIGNLKISSYPYPHYIVKSQMETRGSGDYIAPPFVPDTTNRARTHHVDDADEDMKPLLQVENYEHRLSSRPPPLSLSPSGSTCSAPATIGGAADLNTNRSNLRMPPGQSSPELYARWHKRKTHTQRMRSRLASFIRWMGLKRRCYANEDDVVHSDHPFETKSILQRYPIHHPGYVEDGATAAETTVFSASTNGFKHHQPQPGQHEGNVMMSKSGSFDDKSHSAWIEKEQQLQLQKIGGSPRELNDDMNESDPATTTTNTRSHLEEPRIIS